MDHGRPPGEDKSLRSDAGTHQCPKCLEVAGVVHRVAVGAGLAGAKRLELSCGACAHRWFVDEKLREDPDGA
jgi:hypothetical protein